MIKKNRKLQHLAFQNSSGHWTALQSLAAAPLHQTWLLHNNIAVETKYQADCCKETKSTSEMQLIRRYIIVGERRFSNYCWTIVVFLGAFGFLLKGISTSDDIPFIPQGLLMSFYGSLGILVSIYWLCLIFWNVGGGFNEFNKKDGFIRIFRWGFPGKNRRIDFSYPIKDIEAIKVELKQGLDPQRTIYIRLRNGSSGKGIREIPLTGIGQPLTLKEIEKQASELANYLQVSLEGL